MVVQKIPNSLPAKVHFPLEQIRALSSPEGESFSEGDSQSGFSLMEFIIVITIIAILLTGLLIGLNPNSQFGKARDAKRKSDLALLKKTFEDYYNDKNCYPKPDEVCIDGLNPDGSQNPICTICKNTFAPYLAELPCDPENPKHRYLYRVQGSETNCPSNFRIYAIFSNNADPAIDEAHCYGNTCGPYHDSSYGVSSPNVDLEIDSSITPTSTPEPVTPTPDTGSYECCAFASPHTCQACGSYQQCVHDVSIQACRSLGEIFPASQNCNNACH